MSFKNLVQEMCQRKKFPLPKYQSIFDEKNKLWKSTIIVSGFPKCHSQGTFSSKVTAEQDAAKQFYDTHLLCSSSPLPSPSQFQTYPTLASNSTYPYGSYSLNSQSSSSSLSLCSLNSQSSSSASNKSIDDKRSERKHVAKTKQELLDMYGDNIVYTTEFVSENSKWYCTLSYKDIIIPSPIGYDKKEEVEEYVSKMFLETTKLDRFKKIFLIDLENIPFSSLQLSDSSLYIGFIERNHNSIMKYEQWREIKCRKLSEEVIFSNFLLMSLDGGEKDLSDHAISSFAYPLVEYISTYNVLPEIYIVSRDKASYCTKRCIEYFSGCFGINNLQIKNISQFK